MTWLLMEDDEDDLHVNVQLVMTWTTCIKGLEVSGMT